MPIMKRFPLKKLLILGLLLSATLIIAAPKVITPVSYHSEAQMQQSEPIIVKLASPTTSPLHQHLIRVTLYPGSLKSNIERIAKLNGWTQTEWLIPTDYEWIGKTEVQGAGFQAVLSQILKDYPLQAVFYMGNHVLVVRPRTLR